MSIAQKAAKGALWTIVSSMGGRAIGVIGTLVMTRFMRADEIGAVAAATVLAMTANWITIWGFGQYAVVRGRGPDAKEVTWHATIFYVGLGALSLGAMALLARPIAASLGTPEAAMYIPGMALAIFIRRLGAMPERVLTRRLNFRASGLSLAFGEITYTIVAVGLAAMGWGPKAIVVANVIQSVVMLGILVAAAGLADWTTPHRLSKARIVEMLKFGVPLGVQNMANMASRYWDKLAITYFFGTTATGTYNLAYNLADVPAIQVGEQIALVLMPSMAELPPERRPRALERSTALLSLIIFPLATGLGFIAAPLIALLLPHNEWQQVAPLLAVLACLSIFRPVTWVLSAYLEAESKTGRLMFLELGKLAMLLAGIAALSQFGVVIAATAVGMAFGLTAIAGVAMTARAGVSPKRLAIGFIQPLAACAVMGAVCWIVDRALGDAHPAIELPAMIVSGALAYVAAALIICREAARDLLQLVKQALRRQPASI
jgi:PST family polysaccharide transporter